MEQFLLVGCGAIGERHAGHISKLGKLLAVCDTVATKADALAATFNARAYTDYASMLDTEKEATVAVICTPNGLHASQSIAALEHGLHVLCEKPMAISSADCKAMIQAAAACERQLFIVKQNRFNPPVTAVKKIIDEGRLGKIYSIQLSCFWNRNEAYYKSSSWKGTKTLDGGTLYTQFSHFIDLLYWMFGEVKTVKAFTSNAAHQGIIEFEDSGAAIIEFQNGSIGTINYSVNAFKKNMEGSLTVIGEKGTVKIGGQYLNELEYQAINNYSITNLPAGNPANQYGEYQGSMSNHGEVYQNLLAVLNGTATIAANGSEGLKTVEIIERIYASAK